MKLNHVRKYFSFVGRWIATTLFCVLSIAFVWQGAFFSTTTAIAAPAGTVLVADLGDQVQDKTDEVAGKSKNFIRDTKEQLKETANKNAERVDQATDDNGSFVERKANRDRDRIEQRAEEDAARTEKAVDNSKNAVERAVDNIKDAFSN